MNDFKLNSDTESLNFDNTNALPNLNSSSNNIIKINSLTTMFENEYSKDIISCLPCKAIQTYSSLYKHYINVRNDVKNSLLKCGINNTEKALDLIENEYIKCRDINNDINNEISGISNMNNNKKKDNQKKSYVLIFIQLIILFMFGLFIYFFERRRCICVCPPSAIPNNLNQN
jgi:hypothetical protein